MWLSLLLVALVVGILIRQAAQGLFSAFLTAVLTICCAAIASISFLSISSIGFLLLS